MVHTVTFSVAIFVFASLVTLGCGDSKQGPRMLNEQDTTAVVNRPIDDAPGMSLIFTRTRDDGWRKVELEIGARRWTFHDNPILFMLDANGQGFGDRAVICGMSTPDVYDGTSLGITCSIADGEGLGPLQHITAPTSAWLGDVCIDGDVVTLLYSSGVAPLDSEAPLGAAPCLAQSWSPSTGWQTTPTQSATCVCSQRDGLACTDPCFIGTGVFRDGACDTTGLAPACDDGDPTTRDFCTGVTAPPGELCYAVPGMP